MTYNKNGIPLNKRVIAGAYDTEEVTFEFSLPSGAIKMFDLDIHINAFAIVKSYDRDYLYVKGIDSTLVSRQLRQICGKKMKIGCTVIIEKKGA